MSCAVSVNHEGREYFVDRSMIDTPSLEVENPFIINGKIISPLERLFQKNGFCFGLNVAQSVYLDTPAIDLFANGRTVRVRRPGKSRIVDISGAKGSLDEVFGFQFALKSRNNSFQELSSKIAESYHPSGVDKGVYPYIRNELESEHACPKHASELRFTDLPDDIGRDVRGLIKRGDIEDVSSVEDLILKPQLIVTVKRRRVMCYIDAAQKLDFEKIWPVTEPTTRMQDTGEYLCIEASIDECCYREPPTSPVLSGMAIDDIAHAKRNRLRPFNVIGRTSLFEYEMKQGMHGPNLSDEQAVRLYIDFGVGFLNLAKQKFGHFPLPTRSKAASGFGFLPACRKGAASRAVYEQALAIAP